MRKSTSLTIEEGHIVALDAERDNYTSRSDLINKILDKYFAAGKSNPFGVKTCSGGIRKSAPCENVEYPRFEE